MTGRPRHNLSKWRHLDDPPRRGFDQHRLVVDDGVIVAGDAIFGRYRIKRDGGRQHLADDDGRMTCPGVGRVLIEMNDTPSMMRRAELMATLTAGGIKR
jgi:hypothetical protein